MPKIRVKGVSKRFGEVVALEGVDLEVEDGEYVVILGPSGCGKTTLIKIIAGIWQPTDGRVFVDGDDVTEVALEDRNLGYVFQNIVLFPHMNVKDNAGYGPRVKGLPAPEISVAAQEALELVDMLDQQGFFPGELSGGAQQKASLARALANKASLLLLDEPLSALDARVRVELRYTLRRLVKDLRLTAVHVTHDQEEAMSVADRVVLMRRGRIVEVEEPQQIYDNPSSIFTANFVGESNFLEGIVHDVENGTATIELRGGQFLRLPNRGIRRAQPVVIAARPEHLSLRMDPVPNSLPGQIMETRFMGSFVRCWVRLASGDEILVDMLSMRSGLGPGVAISVYFNHENLLVYPRPAEGLSEALRLD